MTKSGVSVAVLLSLGTALAQTPPSADSRVTPVAGPARFVGRVQALCFGDGSLWLSSHTDGPIWNHQEGNLYRIDPRTFQTVAKFPVSGGVALGEGFVWVRHGPEAIGARPLPENRGKLSKIDPRTNQVNATIPVDRWPGLPDMGGSLAVGEGAVWLPSRMNRTVVRLDPHTHEVVATIPIGYLPLDLTLGEGSLWLLVSKAGLGGGTRQVLRIDPATNRVVASLPVDPHTIRIVAGESWLWTVEQTVPLIGTPSAKISRINPRTNAMEGTPITLSGGSVEALGAGLGGLWIGHTDPKAPHYEGMFSIVDARTGQVKELSLPKHLAVDARLAFGDQAVWLANGWSTGTFLDRVQP